MILRGLAKFFSLIFHPLFILTYMLILLLLVNPYLFGVNNVWGSKLLILSVFLSTVIIPAFSVLMMKLLGFVKTLEMKDRRERIVPYIWTGLFYLWLFINLYYNPEIPIAYTIFVLGATIGLFIAFFINLFSKISMHATGMGGLLGMIIITILQYSYGNFTITLPLLGMTQLGMKGLLFMAIVASGIVGTSRMLLSAHEPRDLYGGFLVGFASQFISLTVLSQ